MVGTDIVPFLVKLAIHRVLPQPSTTSSEGLAQVRRAFSRTLRRLGIEVQVERAHRVPKTGGLVFMWNQESHLDHLVLAVAMPRPFFSLYNNEVSRVPFYGSHMRASGHVHVDRNDEAQWRPAVARAAERVKNGECVLLSPEGTRSKDGRLLPMKRGAFILAEAAERPIVCMTVIGAHERMPRGQPYATPGTIRIVFSDPIDAPDPALVASTFEAIKAQR